MSEYSAGGWLGFFVSEGDVKSNWETSMGEKHSVKSNRVVFTAASYDWLVGTHEGSANAKSFRAGYYYKLSYTAVSSAEASDGILRFYECEPGTFGTASEAWNLRGGVINFGAANAPMTDVRIGMMERNGTTSAVITDSVITLPNGDTIKGGLCVSGNGKCGTAAGIYRNCRECLAMRNVGTIHICGCEYDKTALKC